MKTVGVVVLAAGLLTGCGSDGGGSNARLDGTYRGTLFLGGEPAAVFELVAVQTGNAVSGTYTSSVDRGTFAANVNGSQFAAVLSSSVRRFVCNSSGTYDDDSLSGALACNPGFVTGSFSANRI